MRGGTDTLSAEAMTGSWLPEKGPVLPEKGPFPVRTVLDCSSPCTQGRHGSAPDGKEMTLCGLFYAESRIF